MHREADTADLTIEGEVPADLVGRYARSTPSNLYRRSGYREVDAFNDEPYADHWFERDLTAAVTP